MCVCVCGGDGLVEVTFLTVVFVVCVCVCFCSRHESVQTKKIRDGPSSVPRCKGCFGDVGFGVVVGSHEKIEGRPRLLLWKFIGSCIVGGFEKIEFQSGRSKKKRLQNHGQPIPQQSDQPWGSQINKNEGKLAELCNPCI